MIEKKVKKARKGDEKAFQELIDIEKNKLYRMAYVYVKNEDDALDIVQEAIYKAFISIKSLKHPQYFSTWLSRILINSALDFIKKHERTITTEEMDVIPGERHSLIEEKLDLALAIEELDVPYKTVIILRYYKDFTVKQIAEILDCPEGTIKTRLHRAIRQLKSELKEGCIG
ncbi:sigma-70 family RNA polymerase sigma factor [Rossellomorea vietnamensis]|uniref:sigma-70 family RNA polymerase sigma factor n=1 Tax=Rossellomorea vietnamensis TaxID=218284 RepID=UPI001E4918B5|nr:sigma-70 family RNA polymerase sigma factor [Rossellomorea vietnamensis]MCC5803566.1 sigma-70 family RNA polymerase sigma factor [Rossellomorea vietnamensis]